MSVQLREGIWRMRDGFVTTIYWMPETEGQEAHWGNYLGEWNSDGKTCYTDTDSVDDLVEYLGPIPKTDWSADIARLQAEWQAEFTASQQLRSEVAQLERLLDDARDNLRVLEADGTAMDHHCEGMKAAFLTTIKTLWEMRR